MKELDCCYAQQDLCAKILPPLLFLFSKYLVTIILPRLCEISPLHLGLKKIETYWESINILSKESDL